MNDTSNELRLMLQHEVNVIYPSPRSRISQRAGARLDALAEAAPPILCMLAEPWCEAIAKQKRAKEILRCCALVHLYARILDDAVDENLPCHRQALIKAQPLYWRAVSRLGRLSTLPPDKAEMLIQETIDAVLADDSASMSVYWGRKNHHLLLIPLLLSDDVAVFEEAKGPLSDAICLLQAADELDQGDTTAADAILHMIQETGRKDLLSFLAERGWKRFAWHLHAIAGNLLNRL